MKNMIANQRGITMWGVMFVIAFIAIVILFAVRVFPLYNEKMQIITAMNSVASQPNAPDMNAAEVRSTFYKAIQITNITRFNDRNLKDHVKLLKPTKKGEPSILHVKYSSTNALFADIQLLIEFDEQIPLTGTRGGG